MAEILASRCIQMLNDLEVIDKDGRGMIEAQVNDWVSMLRKIEKLSTNAYNSGRIPDNMQLLEDIAYDIEDWLEILALNITRVSSKNEKEGGIRRLFKRCLYIRNMRKVFRVAIEEAEVIEFLFHEMVHDDDMESVRSVDEGQSVAADRRNVPWRPRQTYAHHDGMVEHFVGMDEDLEKLISLVKNDDHKKCVVSIWGVEGLGKTTLAKNVYIHHKVRTHFDAFAWVSLRQDFQIANVLQTMLKQLDGGAGAVKKTSADQEKKKSAEEKKKVAEEKTKNKNTEEQKKSSEKSMIDQLKEIQTKKKCFIVIDDILEMSQWTDISFAFLLTEDSNTRILITARDETIARDVARDVGVPHELKLLDKDKGWELLKAYVFREKEARDIGIVPKLGKEMVLKCKCLPSSISRLGRILSKTPFNKWPMVNDDVRRYLKRDKQSESDEISYEGYWDPNNSFHLSYNLKQCFLYLGIFKEDGGVDSEDLALLWMAEGMVSPQKQQVEGKEETIMVTAENYLRELDDKKVLQVQVDELSAHANRKFMRICLHNHMRELSLSLGEKENFRLKVVDFSDGQQPQINPYTLPDGIRRLVIHFNNKLANANANANSSPQELLAKYDLRSLLFLNSDNKACVALPVRISDFKGFSLLRVLHFVRCKFQDRKLPKGIQQLFNLRYFGILYCDLDELPSSISNFRNLHVLNVRAYDHSKIRIPNVLSQLVRLKHLHLPANNSDHDKSIKLKLDGLVDLETLVGFNADIHDLHSLPTLNKLQLLVTHAYSNESLKSTIKLVKETCAQANLFIESKCNFTSAEGLDILEEVLICPNLYALTFSMVLIQKFPNCRMHASLGLTQIKLIGCKLREDPMEALGKFPNLEKLWLGYGAFLGREMAIRDTGFLNLEFLEFRCLPNLEKWRVGVGAMQNLSTLIVRQCPKLKRIPKGLTYVSSLKNLERELAPGALSGGQNAEYDRMFAFVKSCTIRELDPLSACSKDSAH